MENGVQRIMQEYNLVTIIEYMKGTYYHNSKKTLQIIREREIALWIQIIITLFE